VEPSGSMDMVLELLVYVLQFESNSIITNKIYHKKGQKYISQQYYNFQINLQNFTHTLQLQYASYDTRDQITRTLKILCLFYYSNSMKQVSLYIHNHQTRRQNSVWYISCHKLRDRVQGPCLPLKTLFHSLYCTLSTKMAIWFRNKVIKLYCRY